MSWSIRILTLFGIPIRLHGSFLILLAVLAFAQSRNGGSSDLLFAVAAVVAVFCCILLHELGHCLVARRFGLAVDSITLLPIGGVAAMRSLPKSPRAELLIALAGPLVSLALAGLLASSAYLAQAAYLAHPARLPFLFVGRLDLVGSLARLNLALAAFNLLPAFPMDGGRLLRAGLWTRMGFLRATILAARTGQLLAFVLFGLGLATSNWMLCLIALFVYLGADAEARVASYRSPLAEIPAHRVMLPVPPYVGPGATMTELRELVTRADHSVVGVCRDGILLGLIARRTLPALDASGGSPGRPEPTAADLMSPRVVYCDPDDSLLAVLQALNDQDLPAVAVIHRGRLVGLITPEQMGKFGLPVRGGRTGP